MVLTVDIGNTNIVFAIIDSDTILFVARIATDLTKTEDQYTFEIKNIIELYNVNILDIDDSIISSVVPQILDVVESSIYRLTQRKSIIVNRDTKPSFNIIVDNIETVGVDRIVNSISALSVYKAPIIIFDMGTATTISVIDSNKNYVGGCIMPGVKTSLNALSSKASQLPYISLQTPKNTIGRNTIECMRSGVINGNAAMIDGMIERIELELGMMATSVVTGGISKFIVPSCKKKIEYDENLLIKGLYIIYNAYLQNLNTKKNYIF